MLYKRALLFILGVLVLASPGWAADIEAGKQRASTCFGCHGIEGISQNPIYPSLAGQSVEYLTKQLNAFRSGERKDTVMTPMANSMSDADVENVAAYFAGHGIASKGSPATGNEREEITAAAVRDVHRSYRRDILVRRDVLDNPGNLLD